MSIKDFDDIKIPKNIDEAIDKGAEKAEKEKFKSKKRKFIKRGGFIAAGLTGFMIFGVSNPALASKIPLVGNVFKLIEETVSGGAYDLSEFGTVVNQSVTSNGVKVTILETFSDGVFLYVSYIIENEDGFKYLSDMDDENKLGSNVLMNDYDIKGSVSFSDEEMWKHKFGASGIQGRFINKNTFVGMESYNLSELGEVPNEFSFEIELDRIENSSIYEDKKSVVIDGEWNFKVPVKVNKNMSKVIELDIEQNGYELQELIICENNMLLRKNYKYMNELRAKEDGSDVVSFMVYDEEGKNIMPWIETDDYVILALPKEDLESIRVVARKPLPAVTDENGNMMIQGWEKEPILDVVIPIK